jgi:hypothetical protein
MQPVVHVLLQAIRDLSRHSENASKSFDRFSGGMDVMRVTTRLASGAKGTIQSDHAPVRSEVGGADRKMESPPVVRTPETVGLVVQ